MEISRETILDKTHYGLKIYSYVLQQYYGRKTTLTLLGRDCKTTRNPFNNDKITLDINIENNIATHLDIEISAFQGDVFDFAKLHFKTNTDGELFEVINKSLNLKLDIKKNTEVNWLDKPDDTWYALCSYYKTPIRNVHPYKTLKLHEIHSLITSDKYKGITTELRELQDVKAKRKFKANNFDYATFSGEFEKRNDKNLIKHSSLLTIDFDHLPNVDKVKQQLLNDEYFDTELLFTSPSGDGLKWIIKIDLSQTTHQKFFKAVANYLQQKYNLEVDQSGKDISRACFLSYDPTAFLHKKHSLI